MCGRFTATFEFSDIRVRWNLDRDLPNYTPRFNIAPETSPNVPVIVRHKGGNEWRREDEEQWLDASRTSFTKGKSVLKPYPEELMDAHDVSPIVNSATYDGPECIQAVADDEITSGGQLSLL